MYQINQQRLPPHHCTGLPANGVSAINAEDANKTIAIPPTDSEPNTEPLINRGAKSIQGQHIISNKVRDGADSKMEYGIIDLPCLEKVRHGIDLLTKDQALGNLVEDQRKIFPCSAYDKSKTNKSEIQGWVVKNIAFKHSLKIACLSDLAMAGASHYYNMKYGLDIKVLVVAEQKDFTEYIEDLIDSFDKPCQQGLIVKYSSDLLHVTPMLIRNFEDIVYIFWLGSVSIEYGQCAVYYFLQSIDPKKKYHVIYVNSAHRTRQADRCSCRSDAVLVLKSALKYNNFMRLFEKTLESLKNKETDERRYKDIYFHIRELPSSLSKTIQRKTMLDELKSSENYDLSIRGEKSKSSDEKSMKSVLSKYTRTVKVNVKYKLRDNTAKGNARDVEEVQDWEVNMYLQTKGYSLVCKAFDQCNDGNGNIDPVKKKELLDRYIIHYQAAEVLLNDY